MDDSVTYQQMDMAKGKVDVDVLSSTLRELVKARSFISSYPQRHPVIVSSCAKVSEMFARLFKKCDEVNMTVSKDALLVDMGYLEQLVPATNSLAGVLSYYGVSAISFQKGISVDEIEKFAGMLLESRAETAAKGGLAGIIEHGRLLHVKVAMVEYDAFRTSDDLSDKSGILSQSRFSLWDHFAQKIFHGIPDLAISLNDCIADVVPEQLATLVNAGSPEISKQIFEQLKEILLVEKASLANEPDEMFFVRLGHFVGGLSPALQVQFLEAVSHSLQGGEPWIETLFNNIPVSVLQNLRGLVKNDGSILSPYVLEVMERLVDSSLKVNEVSVSDARELVPGQETGGEIELLLREEDVEIFVPGEYLETLKNLIAFQDIPELENEQLVHICQSLSYENIGSAISRIIIESLGCAAPDQIVVLKESLLALMRDFVQNGDFRSLENLYESLSRSQWEEGHGAYSVRDQILFQFDTEFAQAVLDSLYVWGKPKFKEIGSLIQAVGGPFVALLLDRLAEEDSITLRRYYLNQLMPLAGQAKDAVLARLNDSRWYVLRNLLSILQRTGDSSVVTEVGRIASFPHPKVRQKVIETLLLFKCSEGDRLLVEDLASGDREVRMQAVQMADKSNSGEVLGRLLAIIQKRELSASSVEEKKAIIRVLAKIGDRRVLPVFEVLLKTRSFFRVASQKVIKKEIVSTLGSYHDPLAIELLEKMRRSPDADIASLAAEIHSVVMRANP